MNNQSPKFTVEVRNHTLLRAKVLAEKGRRESGINLPDLQLLVMLVSFSLIISPFFLLLLDHVEHNLTPTISRVSVRRIYWVGISSCLRVFCHLPNGRNLHLFERGSRCRRVPAAFSNRSAPLSATQNSSIEQIAGLTSSQKAIALKRSSWGGRGNFSLSFWTCSGKRGYRNT